MGVKFGFKLNNSMVVGPDGGGGDVPSELKNEMNEVFNRKFGTSQIYDPDTWADTVNIMTPLPTKTTTGSVATFTDGADSLPMKSVVCSISAVQSGSGDPSPSNVRSISGFTGLNLYRQGKNLYKYPYDSMLNLSGSGQNRTVVNSTITRSSIIPIKSGTTYTLSGNRTGASDSFGRLATFTELPAVDSVSVRFLSYSNNSSATFTAQDNEHYALVLVSNAPDEDCHMQLEVGSSATSYVAYSAPTIIPITWQTEAGTVYGCFVNPITGLLTVTHVKTTVNDLTINRSTIYTNPVFYAHISIHLPESTFGMADKLKYIGIKSDGQAFSEDSVDYDFAFNGKRIYIRADSYSDVPSLKQALGNTEIVYELATPQTFQLTAEQVNSLLGVNNVWHDANGDTTVTYYVDINAIMSQLEA